jgi:hypothetical protein
MGSEPLALIPPAWQSFVTWAGVVIIPFVTLWLKSMADARKGQTDTFSAQGVGWEALVTRMQLEIGRLTEAEKAGRDRWFQAETIADEARKHTVECETRLAALEAWKDSVARVGGRRDLDPQPAQAEKEKAL